MATIGLDRLYYAPITEAATGDETYGTPAVLAKAITAELSVELNEATLYADDGAAEVVKEFGSGTLSLGIDDIGTAVANELTGANRRQQGADRGVGEWRLACGGRLPGKKEQRHLQIFLAVPRHLCDTGDKPADQGRQHHLLYADH